MAWGHVDAPEAAVDVGGDGALPAPRCPLDDDLEGTWGVGDLFEVGKRDALLQNLLLVLCNALGARDAKVLPMQGLQERCQFGRVGADLGRVIDSRLLKHH